LLFRPYSHKGFVCVVALKGSGGGAALAGSLRHTLGQGKEL